MRSAYCHCRHQTRSMRRSSRCLIGTAGSVCPARVSVKRPREEVEALHHLAAGAGHRATARCGNAHASQQPQRQQQQRIYPCLSYLPSHPSDRSADRWHGTAIVSDARAQVKGCNYEGATRAHVKRHMRSHTGDRPFVCSEPGCGYAASQKEHLVTHSLKHSTLKPFKCAICGACRAELNDPASIHRLRTSCLLDPCLVLLRLLCGGVPDLTYLLTS
jgi:hypothetical protein